MDPVPDLRFRRVLLKISGESLMGKEAFGLSTPILESLSREIREVHEMGVQIALVVGGGNFFRGAAAEEMDRVTADQMGMLATLINALALQDAFERNGLTTRVLSALEVRQLAEPFLRRRALRHLERGRIVLLAAGTGNPYFTTDTAAALRAMEIRAEVLLKATKVDGIYTADPLKDPKAELLERVGYFDVLERDLRVMDKTAITLCMENSLPIIVFNIRKPGNIRRIILGEQVGSIVTERGS